MRHYIVGDSGKAVCGRNVYLFIPSKDGKAFERSVPLEATREAEKVECALCLKWIASKFPEAELQVDMESTGHVKASVMLNAESVRILKAQHGERPMVSKVSWTINDALEFARNNGFFG